MLGFGMEREKKEAKGGSTRKRQGGREEEKEKGREGGGEGGREGRKTYPKA